MNDKAFLVGSFRNMNRACVSTIFVYFQNKRSIFTVAFVSKGNEKSSFEKKVPPIYS